MARIPGIGAVLVCAIIACGQELVPTPPQQPGPPPTTASPQAAPPAAGAAPAVSGTVTVKPAPAAATTTRKLAYELDIPGSSQWTDTGIDVLPGDQVTVTATGSVQGQQFGLAGPGGLQRSWRDLLAILPVNEAGQGALVGRIGDDTAAVPFLIGEKKEIGVSRAARLFLGINQGAGESSGGGYRVALNIVPRSRAAGTAQAALKMDAKILGHIPRRVADANGKAGDVVNLLIVGSQQAMQQGFQESGWVLVDRTKQDAVLHALLSSLNKASYVEMPMSELYLFGRAQDYGYARAEPLAVVASRNHLRVWKAPDTMDGTTVWAVAATHDMGFEKDQRTGGVTHHIDPNIDNEREFVGDCFKNTSLFSGSSYLTPADPVHDVQTATGGAIHTDGRVLVIVLGPTAKALTSQDAR